MPNITGEIGTTHLEETHNTTCMVLGLLINMVCDIIYTMGMLTSTLG